MESSSKKYSQDLKLHNRVKLCWIMLYFCVEINYDNRFHTVWTIFWIKQPRKRAWKKQNISKTMFIYFNMLYCYALLNFYWWAESTFGIAFNATIRWCLVLTFTAPVEPQLQFVEAFTIFGCSYCNIKC